MDRFITVLAVLGILFKVCVSATHASQLRGFDEESLFPHSFAKRANVYEPKKPSAHEEFDSRLEKPSGVLISSSIPEYLPLLDGGVDTISLRLKQLECHLDEYLSPPQHKEPKARNLEKENTPAFDFSQTSSVKSFPKAKIKPHSVMESKAFHGKKKVTKNNSNPPGKKRTQLSDTERKKGQRFSKNTSFDFDLEVLTTEQKKRFLSIEKILSEIPAKERKYSIELYKVVAYGMMLRLSPHEISRRFGFSRGNISHIRICLEENGLIKESEI